ncbi:hypothetical protein [Gracilibacillus thailandensis]|uniref:Uncharacterized protein n=1 Tax=Gracilibacillus thailandensis TaxID=563735 RepID=A0A6N7R1E8_9BACI|nr:hypothetical protein [Gracilibacillus thailandensis]MRI66189.1 hypothetical protein [Gracilibacillus thailandensis]
MKEILKIKNEERIELISLFAIEKVYSITEALDFFVENVEVEDDNYHIFINNHISPSKKMLVVINHENDDTDIYVEANGWKNTEIETDLNQILIEAQTNALIFQKMKMLEEKFKNELVVGRG